MPPRARGRTTPPSVAGVGWRVRPEKTASISRPGEGGGRGVAARAPTRSGVVASSPVLSSARRALLPPGARPRTRPRRPRTGAVKASSFAHDDVIGRAARAATRRRGLPKRSPGLAERAGAAMPGLQARHQLPLRTLAPLGASHHRASANARLSSAGRRGRRAVSRSPRAAHRPPRPPARRAGKGNASHLASADAGSPSCASARGSCVPSSAGARPRPRRADTG